MPPDANNLEKITTPLPKLNANGMGPVALGLRETANAIGTAVPATIVMIHDDVDNCSPDTCVAAAEIAKANPNLAIYSIGLGIGPQKLQQIELRRQCHARARLRRAGYGRPQLRPRRDLEARQSRAQRLAGDRAGADQQEGAGGRDLLPQRRLASISPQGSDPKAPRSRARCAGASRRPDRMAR